MWLTNCFVLLAMRLQMLLLQMRLDVFATIAGERIIRVLRADFAR